MAKPIFPRLPARRRTVIRAAIAAPALLLAGLVAGPAGAQSEAIATPLITVYKNPSCGCCGRWVDHLRANGFAVETHDRDDVGLEKQRFGVPTSLYSCHTARVGVYTIEGHVPADDIRRLLAEMPAIDGLAVPGMPQGSPGMETGRVDRYDVVHFDADGNTGVFSSH